MYDPDPARLTLRLGAAPARTAPAVEDVVQRLTLAQSDLEASILRWTEAYADYAAMRAQAQPIPVSKSVGDGMMRYELREVPQHVMDAWGPSNDGVYDRWPTAQSDAQHLAKRSQADKLSIVFRADGSVDRL